MYPRIICHMMVTVDGWIDGEYWTPPFDGSGVDAAIQPYYEVSERYNAQAEMLGRKTIQIHRVAETFDHSGSPKVAAPATFLGERGSKRLLIVLDPTGKVAYSQGEIEGENIIAVLGHGVSEAYLEHLRKLGISYLFAGESGHDLPLAMKILKLEFGIESIILQGGGIVNNAFTQAGLIDEISLMLYPGLDTTGSLTLLGGTDAVKGNRAENMRLELLGAEALKHGVAWMRYRVHKA